MDNEVERQRQGLVIKRLDSEMYVCSKTGLPHEDERVENRIHPTLPVFINTRSFWNTDQNLI